MCLLVTWSPMGTQGTHRVAQAPVGPSARESQPVAFLCLLQGAWRNCPWARPCPRPTAQASWAACGTWWWAGGHCTCWRTPSPSRHFGPVRPREPGLSPAHSAVTILYFCKLVAFLI